MRELSNHIFIEDSSAEKYIQFIHDGKIWILPKDSIATAIDMYQPSTCKGRMLKKRVIRKKKASKMLGTQEKSYKISDAILKCIENAIGHDKFSVAGYMGDETTWQNDKVTLQIYDDKRIIAYMRVTENEKVTNQFQHEVDTIKYLQEKGIDNIPYLSASGKESDFSFFVETTKKPIGQKVKLPLEEEQMDFLKRIHDVTIQNMPYEETDFAKSVNYLKEHMADFTEEQQAIIAKGISKIEQKMKGEMIDVTFAHGDFTPWNIYYTDDVINVFDFEYSRRMMPEYLDAFHYITQESRMGRHHEATGTVRFYEHHGKLLQEYVEDPDFSYTCYLVWIISFYHERSAENLDAISDKFEYWILIMEYLNDYEIVKIEKDDEEK